MKGVTPPAEFGVGSGWPTGPRSVVTAGAAVVVWVVAVLAVVGLAVVGGAAGGAPGGGTGVAVVAVC